MYEYIEISTFSYTMLPPPPPRITQLPSETLFITTIYTYLLREVVTFFSFNPLSHNTWTSRDPFVFPSCIRYCFLFPNEELVSLNIYY